MGIWKGGQINKLPVTTINATVTDTVYIPLGGEGAGLVILQGLVRNGLIKRIKTQVIGGTVNLRLHEIGVVEQDDIHTPLMPHDGGDTYLGTMNTSGADIFELDTWVRDIKCVYLTVENIHGSSNYTLSVTVEWEPAK